MNESLQVRIITPASVLFGEEANLVTMPGQEGEFGILPYHVPLIAALKAGVIKISTDDGNYKYFTYNGIMRTDGKKVDIITEFAVNLDQINKDDYLAKINILKQKVNTQQDSALDSHLSFEIEKINTLLEYI